MTDRDEDFMLAEPEEGNLVAWDARFRDGGRSNDSFKQLRRCTLLLMKRENEAPWIE